MVKNITTKLIIMVLFVASIVTLTAAGWLTDTNSSVDETIFGEVDVVVKVSYVKNGVVFVGNPYYVAQTEGEGSFEKTGIYKINISDDADQQFIKNLRVSIEIRSKVNTYFRVATYEQLTLSYQSGDNKYEVAITQPEKMPFKYQSIDDTVNPYFFDNRDNDGFFYYTSIVKRINDTTPDEIVFIADFGTDGFTTYDDNYSLQLGFIIEAVQSFRGPEINWGVTNKPWDNGVWN